MQEEGYVFVLACDNAEPSRNRCTPGCRRNWQDPEAEVVRTPGQPFHALYHTKAAPKLLQQLEQGELRMMRMLDRLHTELVAPSSPEEEAFRNLNTREDYERFYRGRGL